MKTKLLLLALPLMSAMACTPHKDLAVGPILSPPDTALVAGTVNIWRGVRVIAGSTHVDWSNSSFGVSGPAPTLSFFGAIGQGQQCWLRVTVHSPSVPVTPGAGGTIALTIPPAPPVIGPSPWAATFDNIPAGHWSIAKQTITGGAATSNAVAGTYAGRVFQASTAAHQVTIVDGTVAGCQL